MKQFVRCFAALLVTVALMSQIQGGVNAEDPERLEAAIMEESELGTDAKAQGHQLIKREEASEKPADAAAGVAYHKPTITSVLSTISALSIGMAVFVR